MKKIALLIFIPISIFSQINFDNYFHSKTLRFDYYHIGNSDEESIVFDEMIEEPYWGGSHINLIDTLNFGNYKFEILNKKNNKIIYSRGYSTLFREWQTTKEANKISRSFSESLVFPYPKDSVIVVVKSRNRMNNFIEIFRYDISPKNYFIRKEMKHKFPNFKVHYSGPPSEKLDIVFIPEGFTRSQMSEFKNDCEILTEYIFQFSPFKEMKSKINVWGVEAESVDSLVDIPADSIWGNTILNSSYYTFDSERYLMTDDFKMVRDIAANAPYDQIYILANSDKYGGGAIYNYYSLTAVKNLASKKVFVHELGHGLAGLADEYGYDSTYINMYPEGVEPWETNITTLADFDNKWKNLISEDVPIPTPDEEKYHNVIGVFEGAGYVSKGVYRPTYDSIMRTLKADGFNLVCRKTLEKVIQFYAE